MIAFEVKDGKVSQCEYVGQWRKVLVPREESVVPYDFGVTPQLFADFISEHARLFELRDEGRKLRFWIYMPEDHEPPKSDSDIISQIWRMWNTDQIRLA